MIVLRVNERDAREDKHQDGCDLHQHHDVVRLGRLTNAAHQHRREQNDDKECRYVEPEVPTVIVDVAPCQILQTEWKESRGKPSRVQVQTHPVQQVHYVGSETHAHTHVAEGVLQDQVPADDPRNQFAKRRVRIGVGRPRNRNHAAQFGVAKPGEAADNRHQDHRHRESRTRTGPPRHCTMV